MTNVGDADFEELVMMAVDYWTTVANFMPDWLRVKNREIRPVELRQENISTHSVVLRALGGVGAEILRRYPADWKGRLAGLVAINWNKRNRDWENVCMVANSVIGNRQARLATKAYLKRKLGLPVSEAEQHSITHLVVESLPPSVLPAATPIEPLTIAPPVTRSSIIRPREVRIDNCAAININTAVQIQLDSPAG